VWCKSIRQQTMYKKKF